MFYEQYLEHGLIPVCIKIQGDTVAKAFLRGQPLMRRSARSSLSFTAQFVISPRKLDSSVSITMVQSRFFT